VFEYGIVNGIGYEHFGLR